MHAHSVFVQNLRQCRNYRYGIAARRGLRQGWLGHATPTATQHYAKITPTKLAKSYSDAGYFTRNFRAIEVLVDQELVRNGRAANERDLGLSEISRVALISPYYFGKLFKRSTGQTLHQYVLEQRIRKAQTLLAGTKITLVEIASIVGVANQSHFTPRSKKRWVPLQGPIAPASKADRPGFNRPPRTPAMRTLRRIQQPIFPSI